MMTGWSFESVAEACRVVDAERLAAGIMRPLVQQDFRRDSRLPSYNTADRYLGGQDGIALVLGRVTTGIARDWTEEQWAQNAQFIQDVHEAEGKTLLTKPDITRYASAGLMPHGGVIEELWTSIPAYRVANGILARETRKNAANWTKEESTENGKKFSLWLGRELGLAIMPVQDDINFGIKHDKLQTMAQIKDIHGSLEEFQADLGFVNGMVIENWTAEQWIENFEWLRDVFEEYDLPFTNLHDILTIAGKLRLGPSVRKAYEEWDSLLNYARHVGFESIRFKSEVPYEAGLRDGINLLLEKKRPLTRGDLSGDLTRDTVRHRYGGMNKLNQMLGLASDFRGWTNEELLWWSITWHKPATGQMPTPDSLTAWNDRKLGPSVSKIEDAFETLEDYDDRLVRADMWFESQISCLTSTLKMPPDLFRTAITRDSKLFKVGENLGATDFTVFTQLKERGVDMHSITLILKNGIPFENPDAHLDWFARLLDHKNMLNSSTLKRLMPYVIGLAPPNANKSWSDYIKDYRQRRVTTQ